MNQGHLETARNSDFWLSQIVTKSTTSPSAWQFQAVNSAEEFAGNAEQQLIRVAPAELRMR